MTLKFLKDTMVKKRRTPNKRFGVMRGVCSRKVLREFESFVARPSFCVPPPERQAANRWGQAGQKCVTK